MTFDVVKRNLNTGSIVVVQRWKYSQNSFEYTELSARITHSLYVDFGFK